MIAYLVSGLFRNSPNLSVAFPRAWKRWEGRERRWCMDNTHNTHNDSTAAWTLLKCALGSLWETKMVPLGHPKSGEVDANFSSWHARYWCENAVTCAIKTHSQVKNNVATNVMAKPSVRLRNEKIFAYFPMLAGFNTLKLRRLPQETGALAAEHMNTHTWTWSKYCARE